jgi:hypothetical protein
MPFDPDFDADNPFITLIPERFVEGGEDEWADFRDAHDAFAEDTFDADEGPYAGMEDAAFEMALFGDC